MYLTVEGFVGEEIQSLTQKISRWVMKSRVWLEIPSLASVISAKPVGKTWRMKIKFTWKWSHSLPVTPNAAHAENSCRFRTRIQSLTNQYPCSPSPSSQTAESKAGSYYMVAREDLYHAVLCSLARVVDQSCKIVSIIFAIRWCLFCRVSTAG